MEDKTIEINSDTYNAVVLFEESLLSQINDDFVYYLSLITDFDGKSGLSYDFPDQEWTEAQKTAGKSILDLCESHQMYLEILPTGRFTTKCIIQEPEKTEGTSIVHNGEFHTNGQKIIISDIDNLANTAYSQESGRNALEIDINPGHYQISTFITPSNDNHTNHTISMYIYQTKTPRTSKDRTNINIVRSEDLKRTNSDISVSEAVVKRIENDIIVLSILISPNVTSGYAEIPRSSNNIKIGQRVKIRLIEKIGGRWKAELY